MVRGLAAVEVAGLGQGESIVAAKLGEKEVMVVAGEGEKDVVVGMLGLGRSSTATELSQSLAHVPRWGGGEDEVPAWPPVRKKKGKGVRLKMAVRVA
jgi:hypothetical protein